MKEISVVKALPLDADRYYLYTAMPKRLIRPLGSLGLFSAEFVAEQDPRQVIADVVSKTTGVTFGPGQLRHAESFSVQQDETVQKLSFYNLTLPLGFSLEAKQGQVICRSQAEIVNNIEELDLVSQEFFRRIFY